jgi:hypothetical protein
MQRGRKSAVSLVALDVTGQPPRLVAPDHLNAAERQLFVELIEACSPSHFTQSDLPLVASYVQATLLTRQSAAGMSDDPNLISAWERAVKLQAILATKLRLSPQSRIDPKTLGRQQPHTGRKPWEAE